MAASSPCSISSACSVPSRPLPKLPEPSGAQSLRLRAASWPETTALPTNRLLAPRLETVDDDHLSLRDFKRIADLIGDEVGIKLPPAKRLMIEGRLRKRVR